MNILILLLFLQVYLASELGGSRGDQVGDLIRMKSGKVFLRRSKKDTVDGLDDEIKVTWNKDLFCFVLGQLMNSGRHDVYQSKIVNFYQTNLLNWLLSTYNFKLIYHHLPIHVCLHIIFGFYSQDEILKGLIMYDLRFALKYFFPFRRAWVLIIMKSQSPSQRDTKTKTRHEVREHLPKK